MKNVEEDFVLPPLSQDSSQWLEQLLPELSGSGAVRSMLDGSFGIDPGSAVQRLTNLFFGELRLSLRVLALLLAMGIFLAVLRNLQSSFGRDGVGKCAELAAAAYLTAVALQAFSTASEYASAAVEDLTAIMHGVIPVTLSLMLSGGMAVSGGAIHPLIYFMCSVMSAVVKRAVIPLALFSMALYLLGGMSSGINVNGLADLCQRLNTYLLGFLMVLFTGVLSVTKFAATSFDSVAARGLKFAVSAAVPVVGGSIADAMSSVAGGSILLKNTVGAAGVAALIGVALFPVVKIGALSLVFRVSGALMGPLGGQRTAEAVYRMAGCLEMLVAAVSCVGVMMVISVFAVMGG